MARTSTTTPASLTATITGTSGGNFRAPGGRHRDGDGARQRHHHRRDGQPERLDGRSRAPVANYVFTATLSNASHGVTTIHTDQGDITIADGQTIGTLVIASGNGEDVYNDASSLTATITGTSGGNFEHLVVGTGTATAHVNDTSTDATVNLSASTVDRGRGRELRVHGDAVERLAGRHHGPHRPGRHHDCGWRRPPARW